MLIYTVSIPEVNNGVIAVFNSCVLAVVLLLVATAVSLHRNQMLQELQEEK